MKSSMPLVLSLLFSQEDAPTSEDNVHGKCVTVSVMS